MCKERKGDNHVYQPHLLHPGGLHETSDMENCFINNSMYKTDCNITNQAKA